MKKLLVLFVAAFMFSMCGSGYSLKTSKVLNDANLLDYKTFQLQEPSREHLPNGVTLADAQFIVSLVAKQLEIRGYKQVTTNPDLMGFLATSSQQKVETIDAVPPGGYYGFGYRYFGPRRSYLNSYYSDAKLITGVNKEGMLMLDLVDGKTNKHVFCAEVSTIMDDSGAKLKDDREMEAAIVKLFSKFPVKPSVVEK